MSMEDLTVERCMDIYGEEKVLCRLGMSSSVYDITVMFELFHKYQPYMDCTMLRSMRRY